MRQSRQVSGPRLLLLLPMLSLAFACASPKGADAPAAEDANTEQRAAPAPDREKKTVDEAEPASAQAPGGDAPAEAPSASAPADDGMLSPESAESKRAATSQLEIAVPMINGGLNRDIIRRTASDHADDVRGCHGRALAAMPELAGTIVVALTIDADGHVSEAKLADSSSFASRDAEDCVLALAKDWEFPSSSGGKQTSAELAFALGPQ